PARITAANPVPPLRTPPMNRMSPVLLGVAMLGTVTDPAAGHAAEGDEAKLTAFFRSYLDELFRRHPLEATRLGDHRFDDRLDDLSPKARAASLDFHRDTLRKLPAAVAYEKLTRSAQIDYEILRHHLTFRIWEGENTRPFEEDARLWNEYVSDSVYLLFTQ